MSIIHILQVIAAAATMATGVIAALFPKSVRNFTGLTIDNPRGITEIRAVMGGFFIALGLAPLVLNSQATFTMLGIAYLGVAIVRGVSMLVDKSVVRSNVISIITEVFLGVILVLPV